MNERGVGWCPISFFIPIAMVGIANFQVDVDDGGSSSAAFWLQSIYRQRHQTRCHFADKRRKDFLFHIHVNRAAWPKTTINLKARTNKRRTLNL